MINPADIVKLLYSTPYKFAPASEKELIVFGSARPKYTDQKVEEWLKFIQKQDIKRVCCLLSQVELDHYSDLLGVYRQTFGFARICWSPIPDFHFVSRELLLDLIFPFLTAADQQQEKVVIHCSGGSGRTGHILAAWLILGRSYAKPEAINAVRRMGKNPYEAVIAAPFFGRNPWQVAAEFDRLLEEIANQNESDHTSYT
jgi:protein-tyrosine phosphatase